MEILLDADKPITKPATYKRGNGDFASSASLTKTFKAALVDQMDATPNFSTPLDSVGPNTNNADTPDFGPRAGDRAGLDHSQTSTTTTANHAAILTSADSQRRATPPQTKHATSGHAYVISADGFYAAQKYIMQKQAEESRRMGSTEPTYLLH